MKIISSLILSAILWSGLAFAQPEAGLTQISTLAGGDKIRIVTAAGESRQITKANFLNNFLNTIDYDVTITVGSGGDYATINAAIAYLSGLYPTYVENGFRAKINLLAGFIMEEQVLSRGIQLNWIDLDGVDAQTVVDRPSLVTDFTTADYGLPSFPVFGASLGGSTPNILQTFIFSSPGAGGNKYGVMVIGAGSSANISGGVIDAWSAGLYVTRGAIADAASANFSGAGSYGIYAQSGSMVNADSANVSNAGVAGILAQDGSTVNAASADASGAGTNGISANLGSTINSILINVSNAGHAGIRADDGSTVNAPSATISGVGSFANSRGVVATAGSTININSAQITNQTFGICVGVINGSAVNASSIFTTGSTVQIFSVSVNLITASGIIYN